MKYEEQAADSAPEDLLLRYQACKDMARGYAATKKSDKNRIRHARSFCAAVVEAYWSSLCGKHGTKMKVRPAPVEIVLSEDVRTVANAAGRLIAGFPAEDAGYLIGSIYTVMLPDATRSSLGAYYTPPPLVSRLLDLAEQAGFDFSTGTVIDPACGGGAFLAPVALRMLSNARGASADWLVRSLGKRLKGIEVDPFAAWMTRVLLEAAIMPVCVEARRRLADVVTVADALKPHDHGVFDLVIGNPPYGRLKLDPATRERYSRSLYGHANLYGLFTDLALRLAKPEGVIAYLTPTSFLGGQYFKALREVLSQEASLCRVDFVSDRKRVFDDVLQETMLTAYSKSRANEPVLIASLVPDGLNSARVEEIGLVDAQAGTSPWLLPRHAEDVGFLNTLASMPNRLEDIGYAVSTGPLVWNRHKAQLRTTGGGGALPLVWAECISKNGFVFSAVRRNHVPYISVESGQEHLVTRQQCVLIQRTTSKEQDKRLVAALLPRSMIETHGGVVVENHLNLIQAVGRPEHSVAPETVVALLNSEVLDRAFRCISGSVAVSAYELEALPLPTLEQLQSIDKLVISGADRRFVERAIAACYGVA